jgi:RimJ/RimL family protein N-acetyltransferase
MDAPLDTARLRMRPFVPDDAERAFPMFALDEVGRYTGGTHASVDDTRALIAKAAEHQEAHGFSLWAVEERATGELVGEVGLQLLEHRGPEVEIGWSLHPSHWGRGYAHEAAAAWLDVAFGELGLDEVLATIIPENDASRRLAERLGMALTGERYVHRATHLVYALDKGAWTVSER